MRFSRATLSIAIRWQILVAVFFQHNSIRRRRRQLVFCGGCCKTIFSSRFCALFNSTLVRHTSPANILNEHLNAFKSHSIKIPSLADFSPNYRTRSYLNFLKIGYRYPRYRSMTLTLNKLIKLRANKATFTGGIPTSTVSFKMISFLLGRRRKSNTSFQIGLHIFLGITQLEDYTGR